MLDPVRNFANLLVSTTYDAIATSITLVSGETAKLPDPVTYGAFNLTWYDSTSYPSAYNDPNVEIVRVTAIVGDVLTIIRAQESTTASTKNTAAVVYRIILSPTQKTIDDIDIELDSLVNAMIYKGDWDASAGSFPGIGAAQTGWFYRVSVAGTVNSIAFSVGDNLVATTDNASTTTYAANWNKHDQSPSVTSVAGKTGIVTLVKADITDLNAYEIGGADVSVADGGTGSSTASGARTNLGVDASGTDNSTNVTLDTTASTVNYLSIAGQVITLGQIDLASSSEVKNLLADANISSATTWNGKIANISEDTTPQFGGNADLNKKLIGDIGEYDNGNSGITKTINVNNGQFQKITMTAACILTLTAPTGLAAVRTDIRFIWDATAGWDITFPTSFRWPEGEPTWVGTSANQEATVTLRWNGTNYDAISTSFYS